MTQKLIHFDIAHETKNYLHKSRFNKPFLPLQDQRSFPARRSSDLGVRQHPPDQSPRHGSAWQRHSWHSGDRKSTRLNSSHRCNSYAVFCLKKKNLKLIRSSKKIIILAKIQSASASVTHRLLL